MHDLMAERYHSDLRYHVSFDLNELASELYRMSQQRFCPWSVHVKRYSRPTRIVINGILQPAGTGPSRHTFNSHWHMALLGHMYA